MASYLHLKLSLIRVQHVPDGLLRARQRCGRGSDPRYLFQEPYLLWLYGIYHILHTLFDGQDVHVLEGC
jgi:hypothetical protein